MKNYIKTNAVLLLSLTSLFIGLCLMNVSCVSPGSIPIDGPFERTAERVLDRLDAYVAADEVLSDEAKTDALAESALARVLLEEDEAKADDLAEAFGTMLDRHDAYIAADESLDDLEKAVYTSDAGRLRSLIKNVPR